MKSRGLSPWEWVGRQLQDPRGLAGRLFGHAMEVANRCPNRLAIEALHVEPSDDVLELGFGPGAAIGTLSTLASTGRVYGIDRSRVMLDLARKRNRAAILSGIVVLMPGRFDSLPLPDDSVDKILAVNVVYFWEDAPLIIAELKRVLRPGGLVSIYATDALTMRYWRFAGPNTHRLFDHHMLAALLQSGGFDSDGIFIREVQPTRHVRGLIATACNPQ